MSPFMKYDVKKIEPKWQKKWEDARIFEAKDFDKKPKFYGLVEFPYPSGAGMHVGHARRPYQGIFQHRGCLEKETDAGLQRPEPDRL